MNHGQRSELRDGRSLTESSLRVILSTLLVVSLVWTHPTVGGGSRDLEDGWLLPVAEVVALLGASPAPRTDDAAAGGWLACGQGLLYGMPELPLLQLAGGWRVRRWGVAATWQRLGRELYREDQLRLELVWGHHWHAALTVCRDHLRLGTEAARHHLGASLHCRCPVQRDVFLQISWPLVSPPAWHEARGQQRWLLLTGPLPASSWVVAVDRSGTGVPTVQMGILGRLAPQVSLGLRGELATGSVGLTTAWRWGACLIRSSHLAHPELGLTHRWSVAWGRLELAR
jgi:hypothetical protein